MLLAIDTSTQWVGLALFDGAQAAGEMLWRTQHHHTVELAPTVQALLQRCGVTPKDLSALAVALGPGSFTSLRIGLALAKGMALALNLPVVGIPTLDIQAYAQPVLELPLISVLQSGRGRLAVGLYANVMGAWQPFRMFQPFTNSIENNGLAVLSPFGTPEVKEAMAKQGNTISISTC